MENRKVLTRYIPLLLSLLAGLVLFFLVDDFFLKVVVRPLLWVVWFLSLLLQSVPQDVLWLFFILAMFLFSVASFRKEKASGPLARQVPSRKLGTVERWARWFEFSRTSRYSRWRLAQQLKRFTRSLFSSSQHEIAADLSDLELPPEIRAYFNARQPSGVSLFSRFTQTTGEQRTGLDLDPEVIIQYLERQVRS
jgi:hypothetical protein